MKNVRLLSLICLFGAVALQSCKKQDIDRTSTTIFNYLDEPVQVYLYTNKDDYATNSGVLSSYIIPANNHVVIPEEMFAGSSVHYMDWYSDDFYYNNWYNDDYPVIGENVRISPTYANNTYYLRASLKGHARKTFINGDGTKSSWISVGVYQYSNEFGYQEISSTLTANQRYRQVVVNKGFTADYSYKNSAGEVQTNTYEFMVHEIDMPYIEFKTTGDNIAGSMIAGKLPTAPAPEYQSNSLDTLMAIFPDTDYQFMMIKQ